MSTCALDAAAQGVVGVRDVGRRVRVADLVVAGDVEDVAAGQQAASVSFDCSAVLAAGSNAESKNRANTRHPLRQAHAKGLGQHDALRRHLLHVAC